MFTLQNFVMNDSTKFSPPEFNATYIVTTYVHMCGLSNKKNVKEKVAITKQLQLRIGGIATVMII